MPDSCVFTELCKAVGNLVGCIAKRLERAMFYNIFQSRQKEFTSLVPHQNSGSLKVMP